MKILHLIACLGLLCICTLGDYAFQSRDLGCDYTIEAVIESTATVNSTQMVITVHGNYRKVVTTSVLEDRSVYITETIIRPDLSSRAGYALEITYVSDVGIKTTESAIQTTDGTTVYKYRESTVFNGHQCFKYYNVPSNAVFADTDGYIWGTQQTNNDGEVSTITYMSYDTSKVSAGQFTLSREFMSTGVDDRLITSPNAVNYAKECRDTNETQLYVVEPPSFGCDLKMMYETDYFNSEGNIDRSIQSTVWSHGTFRLTDDINREDMEAESRELVRPDQSRFMGVAKTYIYDSSSGICINYLTVLRKVTFKRYVFTHRDEEYYNGFACYKYYNDSSFEYYVEKPQGLPRAIAIAGVSTTRFIYYDFTQLDPSIFVLDGTELQACGDDSGKKVNSTVYEDACGPVIYPEESSLNNESLEGNDNMAAGNSASIILMVVLAVAALFA